LVCFQAAAADNISVPFSDISLAERIKIGEKGKRKGPGGTTERWE